MNKLYVIIKLSLLLGFGLLFSCTSSEPQGNEESSDTDTKEESLNEETTEQITEPEATEVWEPEPTVVTPVVDQAPPSDAVVLFDGKDLLSFRQPQQKNEGATIQAVEERVNALKSNYEGEAIEWDLENGEMVV
ncbi:MAG: hypothetical protein AAFU64_07780, partial [Bacteroidota bacterium]